MNSYILNLFSIQIIYMSLLFCDREYLCDYVVMLNFVLLNVGSFRIQIYETAVQLLYLLDIRFFQEFIFYIESVVDDMNYLRLLFNDIFFLVFYCYVQMCFLE